MMFLDSQRRTKMKSREVVGKNENPENAAR
jgi:hypothetical protein